MKYKLICFDVNGILFDYRNSWMKVHEAFGTLEEGRKLTNKYLKTDYDKLVEEVVVRLWKGKDATPFLEMVNSVPYMKGIKELFDYLKKEEVKVALVSSGVYHITKRVQDDFFADYLISNELVIEDGKVKGEFKWPIGEASQGKPEVIKKLVSELGISLKEVIYIGDDVDDISVFKIVGKSVAFNYRDEKVKKAATVAVNSKNLKDIMKHLEQ